MKFWTEAIGRAVIVGGVTGGTAFLLWGIWLLMKAIVG